MLFAAGVLGAILGSFLNALLFRYRSGRGMGGRSQCMHCSRTLRWYDLIPVFSFFFLGARCRYCRTKISWQYPLIELAAAALTAANYALHPEPLAFLLPTLLWLTLLFVLVYDLRHQIIPWEALLIVGLLGLASVFLPCLQAVSCQLSALSLVAGPLLGAPLLLISLISRGRAMGWGDGFLELGLGWVLGLGAGLTALCISFWAGALVGMALLLWNKRYTMKSEVPFAPFLILGGAIAYFAHVDLFQALPLLFPLLY